MGVSRPTGTGWVHIPGKMMQISIHEGQIVGINRGNAIFKRSVNGVSTVSTTTNGMHHEDINSPFLAPMKMS